MVINSYDKIILIDLMWAMHTFHNAMKFLSVKIDGEEFRTGSIYGILKNIVFPNIHPKVCIIFCEDNHSKSRREEFKGYKANRAPSISLVSQLSFLKTICLSIPGVYYASGEHMEGDDVISILAYRYRRRQIEIYSGDNDMLQCLAYSDTVRVIKGKNKRIDSEYVQEKYGVPPHALVMLRAIEGDISDNIPQAGKVKKAIRIGTALTYETIDDLKRSVSVDPSINTILSEIERNWRLMKLPIIGNLDITKCGYCSRSEAITIFELLKMNLLKMEYNAIGGI